MLEKVRLCGGSVFNHYDTDRRREISAHALRDYPVFDATGLENRIYTPEGIRIPRVRAFCQRNAPTAGILVKLDSVTQLFDMDPHPEEVEGDSDNSSLHFEAPTVTVYPQAYFQNLGHVKSTATIAIFRKIIDRINLHLSQQENEEHEENNFIASPPLASISCQFYNQLSHRLARRAGTQEVQRGDQTAVMASGYPGMSALASGKGERLFHQCEAMLPFQRHFALLEEIHPHEDTPTALRAENVFVLDLQRLPATNRNGRLRLATFMPQSQTEFNSSFVFDNVIQPLVQGWREPAVWESLRPHLVALRPEVCGIQYGNVSRCLKF